MPATAATARRHTSFSRTHRRSYGEIAFRSVYERNAAEHFGRPGVRHVHLAHGSHARFVGFMRELLTGASVFEAEHVYAAVGAFGGMGVDFIGRLENWDEDWRCLARQLQLPANVTFNRALGAHDSSGDPTGDRAAAAALVASDVATLAALCLILLPDFACLGYALPPGCVPEVARLAAALQQQPRCNATTSRHYAGGTSTQ